MQAIVIHAAKDLRLDRVSLGPLGQDQVRVRIERGGICGSDLHYYQHGGIGTIILKQPMTLGHEVAGRIESVGDAVGSLKVGDLVAVSPSRPCGQCRFCQQGRQMHCLNMRFYGSAMPYPHIQGAFQEAIIADASQCHVMPAGITAADAALCEPFAVCLHAVRRAGQVFGQRVLITGAGPIGILCLVAARLAGATEIIVTDVSDTPLRHARAFGATTTINTLTDPNGLKPYAKDKGLCDVLLECSGNERALIGAFEAVRPQGIIVQVGLGGSFTLPINTIVAKEFELRGTFRFHEEFAQAAQLIGSRRVDLSSLITATIPFEQAVAAFELAGDKSRSMKVQLAFSG
jgi:L-idonate 5-dehydrogenase